MDPRRASLGAQVCEAFDTFAKLPGTDAWNALLERVYTDILGEDQGAAFDALLWVLENKSNYVYQNVAGILLVERAVPCKISLDHFLEIVLRNFDASSRWTVAYMVRSFGKDATVTRVRSLRERDRAPSEKKKLESVM